MNEIGHYFEWHYLPFIISFLFSLIMLSVSQLSGLHGGGHHVGHGHALQHGAHHNAHHSGHHENDKSLNGSIAKGLTFFGVGRLPLTMLIFTAGLMWGFIGFIANMLLQSKLAAPIVAFVLATGIAFAGTIAFTHILGRIFIKIIPPEKEGARREVSLLGELGTSQSTITAESGVVMIQSGNDTFRVKCRIHPGEEEIVSGSQVQLIAYEPTDNLFYCQTVPAEQLPKQKIQLLERS